MFHIYIKQHSITKKKYLGYTKRKDVFKYKGSGKYWVKHIKKHGISHVETLEVNSFNTKHEAWEFAKNLSEQLDVVDSKEWANLKPEGIDGGALGEYNEERKRKTKQTQLGNDTWPPFLGRIHSPETINLMSELAKDRVTQRGNFIKENNPFYGKTHTDEWKSIQSERMKGTQIRVGKTHTDETKAKMSKSKKGKKCPQFVGRKRKYLSDGSWTWEYPKV